MTRRSWLLPFLAVLAGCATPAASVQRVDPNAAVDVSGRWNDTDSRLVAEEMIQDSLSRPWLPKARQKLGATPSVIVQGVRNDSMEHINTGTFVEELQRALINSGRVRFVAGQTERQGVRAERAEQDVNASEATRKAQGQETGADFALSGVITSTEDRQGGVVAVAYQVNLKLIDLETTEIVWNGQKKIKKVVSRAAAGW